MRCSSCDSENFKGAKFCDTCGAPLPLLCRSCEASNRAGARFCNGFGAALGPVPTGGKVSGSDRAASRAVSAPTVAVSSSVEAEKVPEGERKLVTALFADIRGSTELMEDLDPEDAGRMIDPALKLMMDAINRYGGYIVQSSGDGVFALFGAPVAHEDHPQRALLTALRMQQETKRLTNWLRAEGRAPLQMRIGLNTGEVVVRPLQTDERHVEYSPIGHTANLASRMQMLAEPGSVVTSEATHQLSKGYFAFRPLGPTRVKGVSEPVNVYEVTGMGPLKTRLQRAAGQGLTKLVGREREIAEMRRALEQVKQGHGQIVAAIGEAGLGKSRLFYEFKVTSQSGCRVLETFSVSHGRHPPTCR
jgi:class 3 adenylate cyclase